MIRAPLRLALPALALTIALPGLAVAADAALAAPAIPGVIKPLGPPVADAGNATPQEIADWAVVDAAQKDFGQGDYARLAPHLPALQQVMDHAPAAYPISTVVGTTLIMRGASPLICPGLESGKGVTINNNGGPAFDKVRCAPNIYPTAALMLGLYADEKSMPDQGLVALEQGLKLQPGLLTLVGEKLAALNELKRYDAQLAYSAQFVDQANLPAEFRGYVLRARGLALVELGRLDEGQAAYEAALVAQPGQPLAQNELKYIAQLRAGRPPAPVVTMTGAQAATPGVPVLNPLAPGP